MSAVDQGKSARAETITADFLVRIGPPSRGDTIHRASCPHAQRARGKALRWHWVDRNEWRPAETPWLRVCKDCRPDLLPRGEARA